MNWKNIFKHILLIIALFLPIKLYGHTNKIFIIHSYTPETWVNSINKGLFSVLNNEKIKFEKKVYIYHSAYWDKKTKSDSQIEKNRIISEIKKYKPDYIVVSDDEAADFVINDLYQFKKTIIFTGINAPFSKTKWQQKKDFPICGVVENLLLDTSYKIISELLPEAKKGAVLTSGTKSAKIISNTILEETNSTNIKEKFSVSVDKLFMSHKWDDWEDAIDKINKNYDFAWVIVPYQVFDNNGNEIPVIEMGKKIKSRLKKPSIGVISIHTQIGLLASVSVDPFDLGKQTGEILSNAIKNNACNKFKYYNFKYHKIEINSEAIKAFNIKIRDSLQNITNQPKSL